jgi:hypothetical protein
MTHEPCLVTKVLQGAIYIGEDCVLTRALEIRPLILENSILLCQQALGMPPKPEIYCETAYCSRLYTDAALPPQEVSFDMLLPMVAILTQSLFPLQERNVRCILRMESPTNDRPTKFKDPDVTARHMHSRFGGRC